MNPLLLLGVLIGAGVGAGAAIERVGLPRVTAYVLVGVAFSPGLLGGPLVVEIQPWGEWLTRLALGVIAYVIGGSLSFRQLRRFGRAMGFTALGEVLGAVLCVTGLLLATLLLAGVSTGELPAWQFAVAAGAIAASTAPAATVAVVHQYRSRGPLTDMLLGIVAVDDALGILIFSLVVAVFTGSGALAGIGGGALEVAASLALGTGSGLALGAVARHPRLRELVPLAIAAAILVSVGLAQALSLSPLLAAMTLGFSARAVHGASAEVLFAPVEKAEELVFVVFFTLAGLHFDVRVFAANLVLVAVYIFARGLGKYGGARAGARAARAPPDVARYLGFGLVPQAGIAVGLSLVLAQEPVFRPAADLLINLILGATLVHELLGPMFTRYALVATGEVGRLPKEAG